MARVAAVVWGPPPAWEPLGIVPPPLKSAVSAKYKIPDFKDCSLHTQNIKWEKTQNIFFYTDYKMKYFRYTRLNKTLTTVPFLWLQKNFNYTCGLHYIFFFCLFRAAPMAYGGSQARGRIRTTAAGLRDSHGHSNAGSEPCLQPTPQLMATLDPQATERGQDQICVLMDAGQIRFC